MAASPRNSQVPLRAPGGLAHGTPDVRCLPVFLVLGRVAFRASSMSSDATPVLGGTDQEWVARAATTDQVHSCAPSSRWHQTPFWCSIVTARSSMRTRPPAVSSPRTSSVCRSAVAPSGGGFATKRAASWLPRLLPVPAHSVAKRFAMCDAKSCRRKVDVTSWSMPTRCGTKRESSTESSAWPGKAVLHRSPLVPDSLRASLRGSPRPRVSKPPARACSSSLRRAAPSGRPSTTRQRS